MTGKIVLVELDPALVGAFEVETEAVARLRRSVARLQDTGVPVVLFTGCDRTEIEPIREQLGLTAPFVVESGSAIFCAVENHPFDADAGDKEDGYFVVTLGCPYVQARAGLRVIANEISHPLKGFGDFTVPQLEKAAKLSEQAAHRAKAREFSEPFMTPKAVDAAVLCQAATDMGFEVILREASESRFSELIGAGAGFGEAFRTLIEAYRSDAESLEVVMVSRRPVDVEVCRSIDGVSLTEVGVSEETVDGLASAIASLV